MDIIDYDLIADTIRSQNADIVVLNEVRGSGDHPVMRTKQNTYKRQDIHITGLEKPSDCISKLPFGNALARYPITAFEKSKFLIRK